ncbi:hypothetical protein CURE108131_09735 [Cupriavidus respiraculi]|uniref:Uncharacterized protein n=1 Tax=Cupriavidus respiraculi TaxID=195930 RepID=A0ABN7Y6X9_9BURK|nr:hypothetical protein [Cupriavidus respiraculi]CAG9168938.1 hypothetical protein LMG21510_01295 [Cupriavidus respiraculi]
MDDQDKTSSPPDGGKPPVPTRNEARPQRDYSHIVGWGADLDHKHRPAYPKERTPPRLEGLHWDQPEDQPVNMKVYHSTERPGITPVFGTSAPPSGLSGKIRDVAYRLSENDIRHWLLLLFADRVNVVEGIGCDLMRGHVPNVFAEMGGKAELQHNRKGFITKVAVASLVVAAGYVLLKRNGRRNRRDDRRKGRHALPD